MRVGGGIGNEEMTIQLLFRFCILRWGYQKRFNIAGVAEISTISHCIEAFGGGKICP